MENELKSYMSNVDEIVSLLKQKVERIEKERDEWKAKYDELHTKYDNILATESGHESKTENVWQSGYAAGHEAGCERGKWEAQPGAVWVKAIWGMIPDGIHSMKLVSRDNVVMRGTGLVKNNAITVITFLNKSTMGIDDLPKDYEGVFYLDESAAGREEAVEFAEWLNSNFVSIENKEGEAVYVEYSPQEYDKKQQFKIGALYELFKQQKEK